MTRLWGASDDLIEVEGDVQGEIGAFLDDDDRLLVCGSDGTFLLGKYGKGGLGIWSFEVLKKGTHYIKTEQCADEDADPHSDMVYFADGLQFLYIVKEWEKVQ